MAKLMAKLLGGRIGARVKAASEPQHQLQSHLKVFQCFRNPIHLGSFDESAIDLDTSVDSARACIATDRFVHSAEAGLQARQTRHVIERLEGFVCPRLDQLHTSQLREEQVHN